MSAARGCLAFLVKVLKVCVGGHAEGIAMYKDIPFMTSSGPATSSLQNARVS